MKAIAVLTLFFLPASLIAVSPAQVFDFISNSNQIAEQNVSLDHL